MCNVMMDTYNSLPLSLTCEGEDFTYGSISVDCDITDTSKKCNVSITNCNQYYNDYTTSATEKTMMPEECKCNTDIGPSESSESELTSEGVTKINGLSTDSSSNSTIVAVLGALVGLLLVLLVIVTTGLVWTCWLLKKRGGLKLSSESQMR